MKYFVINTSAGIQSFTKKQYLDARSTAQRYVDVYGYDGALENGVECFLNGTVVTIKEFVEACNDQLGVWYDKKCETHKLVKVLHGSSAANYVWVWVKK